MYGDDTSTELALPDAPVTARSGADLPCGLDVRWAGSEAEVREAQRLRYRVFAQENGARDAAGIDRAQGLETDRFDPFCDHLLVRAVAHGQEGQGPLVGTYRVLGPQAALRAGGLYSDTEFDLAPLAPLRARAVELGRSCVHPSWRSGGVIMALWTALCQYMQAHGLETMIGCASVSLDDGGLAAAALWHQLRHTHLAQPRWRVTPRQPLDLGEAPQVAPVAAGAGALAGAPPLIKGYLRSGARLLGPPAVDTAFNTADLPMMLHVGDLAPRYRRRFFRA